MKNFVNHLSCFNMNESQYWVIPDLYQRFDYEISWIRTMTGTPVWKVRAKGEEGADWEEFSNKNIVLELSKRGVDLVELQNQITETILRQAVYATQITNSAKELLGTEVVDKAVVENEIFVEKLVEKIKNALNSKIDSSDKEGYLKLIRT